MEKARNQWLEPRVIALENGSAHSQHTDETLMKKNEKQMDVQNEKGGKAFFGRSTMKQREAEWGAEQTTLDEAVGPNVGATER